MKLIEIQIGSLFFSALFFLLFLTSYLTGEAYAGLAMIAYMFLLAYSVLDVIDRIKVEL